MTKVIVHNISGKPFSWAPVTIDGKKYVARPDGSVDIVHYVGKKQVSLCVNGIMHTIQSDQCFQKGTQIRIYNSRQQVAEIIHPSEQQMA